MNFKAVAFVSQRVPSATGLAKKCLRVSYQSNSVSAYLLGPPKPLHPLLGEGRGFATMRTGE